MVQDTGLMTARWMSLGLTDMVLLHLSICLRISPSVISSPPMNINQVYHQKAQGSPPSTPSTLQENLAGGHALHASSVMTWPPALNGPTKLLGELSTAHKRGALEDYTWQTMPVPGHIWIGLVRLILTFALCPVLLFKRILLIATAFLFPIQHPDI